jgi:hypothetical protein
MAVATPNKDCGELVFAKHTCLTKIIKKLKPFPEERSCKPLLAWQVLKKTMRFKLFSLPELQAKH